MKVAVIYNKREIHPSDVINTFGPQTRETYNPRTVELVASALEKGGHNVRVIEGNINVADSLRAFMPRELAGERPGMVFNMAYGIQGQSRYTHLPATLEMLGVPYVGSGPQAHAVALDKILAKIVFQQHAVPTPRFWFFTNPEDDLDSVTFPVIVKPKMEAVSMGLKIVDNKDDLREAVREIVEKYQQQALVEAFVAGREFAVGLLGNGGELEVLPIVEFDFAGDPNAIQSYSDKMSKPAERSARRNFPTRRRRNCVNSPALRSTPSAFATFPESTCAWTRTASPTCLRSTRWRVWEERVPTSTPHRRQATPTTRSSTGCSTWPPYGTSDWANRRWRRRRRRNRTTASRCVSRCALMSAVT